MYIGLLRITREGLPYALALLGLAIILAWIHPLWSILPLICFGYVLYFFRDPVRNAPADPLAIISAADGKIVGIDELAEPYYLNKTVRRVSIFLSIFDVHINRSPVAGKVDYIEYHEGKFHNALEGKSSILNEHNLIGMENHHSKVCVKQIAGMIARRIVCYCSKGDEIKAGEKIGLIKFGSRVEIFMPLETEILVQIGQKVKGGETIIGRLPN